MPETAEVSGQIGAGEVGGSQTEGAVEGAQPSAKDAALERMDAVMDRDPSMAARAGETKPRAKRSAKQESFIDDAIRARGAAFNFADADLQAFGSKNAAERYLDLAENAARMYEELQQFKNKPAVRADEPPKPAPAAEAMKFPIDQWLKETGLDPADMEPALLKVLGRLGDEMTGHFDKKVKALEETLKPLQESRTAMDREKQQAAVAEFNRAFESAVSGLGAEWEEVFGKGHTGSLPVMSAQRRSRDRLAGAIHRVVAGYAAAKMPLPPDDEIARQALYGEFRKEVEERLYAGLAAKSREASNGFTNRPGPRPSLTVPAQGQLTDAQKKARAMEQMDEVIRRKGIKV